MQTPPRTLPYVSRSNSIIVCSLLLIITFLQGCDSFGTSSEGSSINFGLFSKTEIGQSPNDESNELPNDNDTHESSTTSQRQVIVRKISFEILRTRVRKGVFSESEKIWNHLDEEALPAETALFLQRNGLRVARGKFDSWPPIKALLENEEKLTSSSVKTPFGGGRLCSIEIDPRPRDQILFIVRKNGTIAGADYPQSTNLLRIEYSFSINNPDSIIVVLMPEIRSPYTEPRVGIGPNGIVEYPARQPSRVFRELAFQVELQPNEFLVVGPGKNAHHGHLVGSLLLCEQIDGNEYESMYFITPKIAENPSITSIMK